MFLTLVFSWLLAAIIIYAWCYIVEVVLDLPVTGQTPCTAHASLKNIIRRVLRDAANMAILKEPQDTVDAIGQPTASNRTYEDLLATAILNKVIDNYQSDLRRSSSGSTSSKKSDTSKKHKKNKNKKGFLDQTWRQKDIDVDTTSMSSVEDWCRSESSCGSKYVDHMSFTIQQSIEEVTTSDEESPSQQYLHSCNPSRNSLRKSDREGSVDRENWQDNWLFSRKGKGSPKPVPVPMLVPNPSTDYRALIGDRDAEDTTDLSETGSDLDEAETVPDIKTILVDSRTIIGGKNLLENIHPEVLDVEPIIEDSEEVEEPIFQNGEKIVENEDFDDVSEAKNGALILDTPYAESDSLGSNTEKDAEYTEKYASFPRQISKNKSPIPSPRPSKGSITQEQREELITQSNGTGEEKEESEPSDDEGPIILRGSYSDREKQKWRNPIALADNPYSKENLDKRLSNRSSIDSNYSYGRDYYIREAKKAAGGRQKLLEDPSLENSELDFQRQKSEPVTENNIYERSYSVHQNIFKAIPVVVESEISAISEQNEEQSDTKNDQNVPQNELNKPENRALDVSQFEVHKQNNEVDEIPTSRPVSLAFSTDSEDFDVKRVYNIETGKVFKYKGKDITKEIIQNSKSPEGIKNIIKEELVLSNLPDEFDENHNETYEKKSEVKSPEPVMKISALNHLIQPVNGNNNVKPEKNSEYVLQPGANHFRENNYSNHSNLAQEKSQPEKNVVNDLVSVDEPDFAKTEPKIILEHEKGEISEPESVPFQGQIRDESKKYLKSLVKNKNLPIGFDIINSCSTPPISLHEYSTDETSAVDSKQHPKSCIDLRFINQDNRLENQFPTETEQIIVKEYLKDFTKSTPNLHEDRQYNSEDNEENIKSSKKTIDPKELSNLPSVKNLRKIFDQDKPKGVKRTTSHLTTKPEFRAHQKQVHSLTARSISREFRLELQKPNENRDSVENNGVAHEEEEIVNEDELKVIPPCKSKIAFFEQLKQ